MRQRTLGPPGGNLSTTPLSCQTPSRSGPNHWGQSCVWSALAVAAKSNEIPSAARQAGVCMGSILAQGITGAGGVSGWWIYPTPAAMVSATVGSQTSDERQREESSQ